MGDGVALRFEIGKHRFQLRVVSLHRAVGNEGQQAVELALVLCGPCTQGCELMTARGIIFDRSADIAF